MGLTACRMGRPVVGGAHAGRPLRERVTGSDTVPLIAELARSEGYRLYLLGAAPGVAEQAAAVLTARLSRPADRGHLCGLAGPGGGGRHHGAHRRGAAPTCCSWPTARRARICGFTAIWRGWACRCAWASAARLILSPGRGRARRCGCGAAGLEWLYRLIRQPWRWRRMLALPRFAWLRDVPAVQRR